MTEPRELVLLSPAERMVGESGDIDTIRDLRAKARIAKAWAKKAGLSRDSTLHAATIKVQAERPLGEMLLDLPMTYPHDATRGPRGPPRALAALRTCTSTTPHHKETE